MALEANVSPAMLWPGHPDSLGSFYIPGTLTYPAAAVPTQNRAFGIPIAVHRTTTFRRFGVLNGATINGNFDVGIYTAPDGGTSERINSIGATLQVGANNAQFVTLATPVTLNPGVYMMVFSQSSATGTYQQMPSLDAAAGWLAASNAGQAAILMGILVMAAAHPLPATITWAVPNAAADDVPPFIFLSQSST